MVRIAFYFDFIDLRGYQFTWQGMQDVPVRIGNIAAEHLFQPGGTMPSVRWVAMSGAGGTIAQTLAPTPDSNLLESRLFYRNSSEPAPPESYPGEHPAVGFLITGWERLSRGTHYLDSLLVTLPPDYDPEALFKELNAEPTVTIRETTAR